MNDDERVLDERLARLEERLSRLDMRVGTPPPSPPLPSPPRHRGEQVKPPPLPSPVSRPPPLAPTPPQPVIPVRAPGTLEEQVGLKWAGWVGAIVVVIG